MITFWMMKKARTLFGVSVLFNVVIFGASCSSRNIAPGSVTEISVDNERWSRRATVDGCFSFVYQGPNSEIQIGLSRWKDPLLPAKTSVDEIVKHELKLLHRRDDLSVVAKKLGQVQTSCGAFEIYNLKSDDLSWRLRLLAIRQNEKGEILDLGIYSTQPDVTFNTVQENLEKMCKARLLK